jgi:hypothetical protein
MATHENPESKWQNPKKSQIPIHTKSQRGKGEQLPMLMSIEHLNICHLDFF